MTSLKELHSQIAKIRASLPPQQKRGELDASLFTEHERYMLCKFSESLPRPLNLQTLSDEQVDERIHWLSLARALYEGNTAEAEKLRRRYGVSLEQLVDRFLNLDISAPPGVNEPGPCVQEDNCIYDMSRGSYRYIEMDISFGRANRQKDAMWRWIDFIEQKEGR